MKVLYNAVIQTLHGSTPLASALVIDHGEVVRVGGDELLSEFQGGEKQDLRGRVVLPGLIDAHLRLKHYALSLQEIGCETDPFTCDPHELSNSQSSATMICSEWVFQS